ncbi:MAG: cytochrome b/b6 domain-containing protein [Pseudomonadota bacterium]|nr:cytochrome b/b6 domain-containing protein [Pseudomonadota bacterium]
MDQAIDANATLPAAAEPALPRPARRLYRHKLPTRIWHWLNAVTIIIMIGSGIGILNAHPRLYWGAYGANYDHAWLDLHGLQGILRSGWLTIPSGYNLAISRRWHLLFALVLAFGLLGFMIVSLINRHFQRALRVRVRDLRPAALWHDVREHLAFRFHDPANPIAFNIFQKLSYVGVIFVLIPVMILTGLTMSPGMDAALPWLLDLFGGRQSARSIHFICATALVAFIIVHLVLVILAGPISEVRSMVTGWWRVPEDEA